jgi:hypothetical protein
MNPMFNSFKKNADVMITDQTQRSKIISAALAKAVSDLQTLPTSQVESPSSYFNLQILPNIRTIISVWNENMVFDPRACVDHVRAFWLLRYTAVHPVSSPIYSLDRSFFECVFGVNTFVASDTNEFFNTHKQAILFLSICAAEIINKQQSVDHG